VIVAGAGIGGLTTALALARNGFRVVVLEQAGRLEETGAGIQLPPNATRALIDLGLDNRLRPHAVAPTMLRVLSASTGSEIIRMPLGETAEQRYGAPYWVIHRGDLQAALAAAVARHIDVSIRLGTQLEDFITHRGGVAVSARSATGITHEHACALIAADGLWSAARARLGYGEPPRFAGRTAWRGLVSAKEVAPEFREPVIHLWLGRKAHLVHYAVKGGRVVNIVAITSDDHAAEGWSAPASRADLIPRFAGLGWVPQALTLVSLPEAWLKWALYDRRPLKRWSRGPVALLGDAAHPMLPYLAQGAAMAIEDAVVVAQCLARMPDDAESALETYCATRRTRAWKVQRLAARNGALYHQSGISAALRNSAMHLIGGTRLFRRFDWLYDWRPPPSLSIR
jgi:salicylate hydroxylase